MRITEYRYEQSIEHARKAKQQQQQYNGEIIAMIFGIENHTGQYDDLNALQQHHHRLRENVSDEQFRGGNARDKCTIPDAFETVRDEDGRCDECRKEKYHSVKL